MSVDKIEQSFKPAWWLNNPHLQTIYPALFRKLSNHPELRRERFITPDNDYLDIDFCGSGIQPLIILLHGLTGSSQSGYIKGLQLALDDHGFRSAAVNFRGCSGESNNKAKGYHSGETQDIHFVYQTIHQREPKTKIAVVGFSLGGNVLLKWLGEQRSQLSLFSAVAISVPFLLNRCATKLDSGFSIIYRENLIQELKKYIQLKYQHLIQTGDTAEAEKIFNLGDLTDIKSFWQYDDRVVARLHGFRDAEDFYQQSSSRQYLKKICTKTLIIHSEDDPFMTSDVIPGLQEVSSKVTMEITNGGGHVGFVTGRNPIKPQYWLEQRIISFLKEN